MSSFILGFLFWAVLHSVTAAQWMKNLARQMLGKRRYHGMYRLAYNTFAVVTFVPVLILYWRLEDVVLWSVPSPWRWLLITVQLGGLIGLVASLLQSNALAFMGLEQMVAYLEGKQDFAKAGLGEELVVDGLYRYMRHPLYTFSLVMIWFIPVMTRNYLILAVLFTLYFIVGSFFEERRLTNDFGPAYAAYRNRVPRFIPRPWS